MADPAAAFPINVGVTKSPADFLKSIKGKPVVVKLNSGVDYRGALPYASRTACIRELARSQACCGILTGILACLDGYMNLAMEQTEVCVGAPPVGVCT